MSGIAERFGAIVPPTEAKQKKAVVEWDKTSKALSSATHSRLLEIGKEIKVRVHNGNVTLQKTIDHGSAIDALLREAMKLLGGNVLFEQWRAAACPGLSKSWAYELRAVALGKKTVAQIAAGARERKAKSRAAAKAAGTYKSESVTVTPTPPAPAFTAPRELTTDEAKARFDTPEATDAPPLAPDAPEATTAPAGPTAEDLSEDALNALRAWGEQHGSHLSPADLKRARVWFNQSEWRPKKEWNKWQGAWLSPAI
jgi:hypothetical protein